MKKFTLIALSAATTLPALAGGMVHNTNHNAAFLRQFSQGAIIDVTGLYFNPAGTAFLEDGFQLSLNAQNAAQTRSINTTFPLMALNTNGLGASRDFKGEAYAPVIPSFQLSWNHDKWSLHAEFAISGGGGKCEFDEGLGTFECLYAGQLYSLVPTMVNAQLGQVLPGQLAAGLQQAGVPDPYATMLAQSATYQSQLTGYALNAYMKGRNYQFGLTLGGTYKVLDNLAVSLGVRALYATNNYNGWVQDINAKYAYTYGIEANPALGFPGTQGNGSGEQDLSSYALSLNTDQTGLGFAPIIGVDWRINEHWNVAARYEMKTRLRLTNKSEMNAYTAEKAKEIATLAQFADGAVIAADAPSVLNAGVQYSPVKSLRLMASAMLYGDKNATRFGNTQELIDHNEFEWNAGAEWDCCKWLTLSASFQMADYGGSDAFMSDVSFDLDANSIGLGARVKVSDRFDIDLGYMKTFYYERTVNTANYLGSGLTRTDVYDRENRVLGVGLNLKF